MLFIHKITDHETVDFAAAELKKYLRMMMPAVPDVKIDEVKNCARRILKMLLKLSRVKELLEKENQSKE